MLVGMILVLLFRFRGKLAWPCWRRRFRRMSRMGLLAQMPFHPEMNSQNDGDDGHGANHQNRKQNLHHHGISGYQNGVPGTVIFIPPKRAFTRTRFVPYARWCSTACPEPAEG